MSTNMLTATVSQSLDDQFEQLLPYVADISDDLPLLDIMIGRGAEPNQYRASAAIYLHDGVVQTRADHRSVDTAIRLALISLMDEAARHHQAQQRYHRSVKKFLQSDR